MPRIPTFEAGNLSLRPSEVGVEATAGAARRVGGFYNQQAGATEQLARETSRLGQETENLGTYKANLITGEGARLGSAIHAAGDAYVKYQDHQQISAGAAAYAGLLDKATKAWNETAKHADPTDPTVAKQFMEGLEPQLEEFKSGFWTEGAQQWAENHTQALRTHLQEKTSADMATLAGQAAIVSHHQTINNLSSAVHEDPSSLGFAMETLKSTTEAKLATSPNLTATEAGRARTEMLQKGGESIVKSAAIGAITKTGQVPDWIKDPKFSPYVNGAELQQFAKAAKAQQRSDALAEKQNRLLQQQLDDRAAHTLFNKAITDNAEYDPSTGRMMIKPELFKSALDIPRKLPDASNSGSLAKALIDWGESQQRERSERVVSDPAVRAAIYDKLLDPNASIADTKIEILKQAAADKLSPHHTQVFREMANELEQGPLKDPLFKDVIEAAKERVGFSLLGDGKERFANAMTQFLPEYMKRVRAGTAEPGDLDLKDENSFIRKSIKQFEPSPQEKMEGAILKSKGIDPNVFGGAPKPQTFTPPTTWEWSEKRKQYRDPATQKVYDANGREVK